MTSTTTRQVRNLALWGAGAAITQALLLAAFIAATGGNKLFARMPNYLFAEEFALLGVLIGLLIYALAAATWPTNAATLASLQAGVLYGAALAALLFATGLFENTSLWISAGLCCMLAVMSYFFARRRVA
jgi:hypothetical protein